MRQSSVERKTKETKIKCKLNIDGSGIANVNTKIGFFDHMLNTFAKHSSFDLDLVCDGDINVDTHHSVEDTGIVIGQTFKEALVSKDGINRYYSFVMPMDDALVLCAIDLCGRSFYQSNAHFNVTKCGDFECETADEFFRSFADNAMINLHFDIIRGQNAHHIIEAMFKSFAKCIKEATRINSDIKGSLSTKGVI